MKNTLRDNQFSIRTILGIVVFIAFLLAVYRLIPNANNPIARLNPKQVQSIRAAFYLELYDQTEFDVPAEFVPKLLRLLDSETHSNGPFLDYQGLAEVVVTKTDETVIHVNVFFAGGKGCFSVGGKWYEGKSEKKLIDLLQRAKEAAEATIESNNGLGA